MLEILTEDAVPWLAPHARNIRAPRGLSERPDEPGPVFSDAAHDKAASPLLCQMKYFQIITSMEDEYGFKILDIDGEKLICPQK